MNKKQFILILGLVVVIGAVALWLRHRQARSYYTSGGAMGQKVLKEFDPNAVAQIVIQEGTNTLHLVRKQGRWTVQERGGYPANFEDIRDLVRKLWELKIIQPIRVTESARARLHLLPPDSKTNAAVRVDLKDQNGRQLAALLLGKKHYRKPTHPSPYGGDQGWPDGRYVMVPTKPSVAFLVNETFSNVLPHPDQWLDKTWFRVQKIKTIALEWPDDPTNSWKLVRDSETAEFQLADTRTNEELDTTKISGIRSAFAYPSFNDVVVDADPKETGLDHPITVHIDTFDDFHYTIQIGKPKQGDVYYLKLDVKADIPQKRTPGKNESKEEKQKLDQQFEEKIRTLKEKFDKEKQYVGWVYKVSKWTVQNVLKKRSEFVKTKSAETTKPKSKKQPSSSKKPEQQKTQEKASSPKKPIESKISPAPKSKSTSSQTASAQTKSNAKTESKPSSTQQQPTSSQPQAAQKKSSSTPSKAKTPSTPPHPTTTNQTAKPTPSPSPTPPLPPKPKAPSPSTSKTTSTNSSPSSSHPISTPAPASSTAVK